MSDCHSTFEFLATPGDPSLPGHVVTCERPALHEGDHIGQVGGRLTYTAASHLTYHVAYVSWAREDDLPDDVRQERALARPGVGRMGRPPQR